MSDTLDAQVPHDDHDSTPASEVPASPDAPTEPTADGPPDAAPPDAAPPLAALMAAIRAAVAPGAPPDARAAGAVACRSILTVLEAKPGQPLGSPTATAPSTASPIASLFSQPGFLSKLAAMPRDQLLELIKQATGALQPRAQTPASAAPRFHLIQIPNMRPPRST